MFIGALVLKNESLTCGHVVKVIIMFVGVMLIILGKRKTVELTKHEEGKSFNLWYFAIMATAPLAIVLINIPMATLRVLNQVVVPFYMCCISTVVYGIVCIIQYDRFMPTDEEA